MDSLKRFYSSPSTMLEVTRDMMNEPPKYDDFVDRLNMNARKYERLEREKQRAADRRYQEEIDAGVYEELQRREEEAKKQAKKQADAKIPSRKPRAPSVERKRVDEKETPISVNNREDSPYRLGQPIRNVKKAYESVRKRLGLGGKNKSSKKQKTSKQKTKTENNK